MVEKNASSETGTVLVADDDAVTRRLLEHHLSAAGFRVIHAADGQEAMRRLDDEPEVALLDLNMPKASGMDCLRYAREKAPRTLVIVISQFGELRDAVEAMKIGATDYVTKDIDSEELTARVRQALRAGRLARENQELRQVVAGAMPASFVMGQSAPALALRWQVEKIAPLDDTVLITGENGTGKTTLARMLHLASPRAKKPFVPISCANLPRDLVESELFGHVRGAFTGAIEDRIGKVELADGGTFFLDEIGDLPLELQPKLLTFLQERTVQRIGEGKTRPVNIRLIAATNQNLEKMCHERLFREDLYFRINVFALEVPSLRDRPEDILPLAEHLLVNVARKRQCPPFRLTQDALSLLTGYAWPGNVRQLENVLHRASALCSGNVITATDLHLRPWGLLPGTVAPSARENTSLAGLTLAEVERRAIADTLRFCQGNKKRAAKVLGIDEKSIYNKMKRLGIIETSDQTAREES